MQAKVSTQRDSQMLRLALAVLLAASTMAAITITSASVATGEASRQQQLLANEKSKLFNSIYNNRQQQHSQVIANDLQEQPEAEATAAADVKPQPQAPAQPKLVSQGGVINGNHATYVEPPADFKPIIYDYEHNSIGQQQQRGRHHKTPSDSSESANQLMASIASVVLSSSASSSPSSPQQQQAAQGEPPVADSPVISSDGDSGLPDSSAGQQDSGNWAASSAGSEPLPPPQAPQSAPQREDDGELPMMMKPMGGRWNDWHDMSIEPDLASSDSFEVPSQFAAAPPQYRSIYYAPAATKTAMPFWAIMRRQPAVDLPRRRLDSPAMSAGRFMSAKSVNHRVSAKWPPAAQQQQQQWQQWQQPPPSHPQQQPQFQIKGGQQAVVATASGPAGSGLPLNLISPSNRLIKMQQDELNQQQASPSSGMLPPPPPPSPISGIKGLQWQPQHTLPLAPLPPPPPAQEKQSNWKQQPQRRLKRRRKSKTNAEVRILQLVAASQEQELAAAAAAAAAAKQVNGPTNGDRPTDYGQQQQQQQQQPAQVGSGEERVPMAAKRRPSPVMVVKRFGSFPVNNNGPPATITNSTAPPRRVVKRRRVKTLLPVGLSSWFLGGIRDLDGRHWQLPADVMSRLAVNDVDFNADQPKVMPPSSGSVVLIGGNQGESENFVGAPTAPRVPISNQPIPR